MKKSGLVEIILPQGINSYPRVLSSRKKDRIEL